MQSSGQAKFRELETKVTMFYLVDRMINIFGIRLKHLIVLRVTDLRAFVSFNLDLPAVELHGVYITV